ncbi:MAG: hypothetical protein B7Z16_02230 [Algoriphagus sp. 32-45-6]|nr:MAG: hypothetical protein B7Z16_02230 [Algoriphagus sp. 32-45-6]
MGWRFSDRDFVWVSSLKLEGKNQWRWRKERGEIVDFQNQAIYSWDHKTRRIGEVLPSPKSEAVEIKINL